MQSTSSIPTPCDGGTECTQSSRRTRGMCGKHYSRWLRANGPEEKKIPPGVVPCDGGPGCTDSDYRSFGMCVKHYTRWFKYGEVGDAQPKRVNVPIACAVEGCGRDALTRGWCGPHYQRWRKHGDVQADKPFRFDVVKPPCSVDGCDRITKYSGLCAAHYGRLMKTGSVSANVPIKRVRRLEGSCSYGDCQEPIRSNTFCRVHYIRDRRGYPMDAPFMPSYAGNPECEHEGCARSAKARGMCIYHYSKLRCQWRHLPRNLVDARMEYFGRKCWICGGPFEHVDHVKPSAKGGLDMLSNLRPSCASCNQRKNAEWPFDAEAFRRRYGIEKV